MMAVSAALAGAVCACAGWQGWKLVAGWWRQRQAWLAACSAEDRRVRDLRWWREYRAKRLSWPGQAVHQRLADEVRARWMQPPLPNQRSRP